MDDPKRGPLTRELLIETGLRLLDEVGLDGLTVRRLATELGVQSPALYWHLRNKQELLDGMADAITLGVGMGGPRDGETWPTWLARRGHNRRQSLLAHRDGARLVADARLGPATLRLFDEELAAMVGCGFTPVLAVRTIGAVAHYVSGFVLQEQTRREPYAASVPDAITTLEGVLAGGRSAALVAAIRDGGNPLSTDAFDHGLRMLIDGAAAALARMDAPIPPNMGRSADDAKLSDS